jgi:hypothetical protein
MLRLQVLRVAFTVAADDPGLGPALRFLDQSARQPEPPSLHIGYQVVRGNEMYEIQREGVLINAEFDHAGVVGTLYAAIQHDALAAWPEATVLRGVVGRWQDQRFVVAGDGGRERSGLALALLAAGASIEGDDLALVDRRGLTTYPRALRVGSAMGALPTGIPGRETLPFSGRSERTGVWALDPRRTGRPWRVETGPVQHIVEFTMNDGGMTRVGDLSAISGVRTLMMGIDPRGGAPAAIRDVSALSVGARCHRLWLGSFGDVSEVWRNMMS